MTKNEYFKMNKDAKFLMNAGILIIVLFAFVYGAYDYINIDARRQENLDKLFIKAIARDVTIGLPLIHTKEFPTDIFLRSKVIDEAIYKSIQDSSFELASSPDDKSKYPVKEFFYRMPSRADSFAIGLNKNDLRKDREAIYILRKKDLKWNGYRLMFSIDGKLFDLSDVRNVDQEWLRSNVEPFPRKGMKTYNVFQKNLAEEHGESGLRMFITEF